jgi:putative oxidoreductase
MSTKAKSIITIIARVLLGLVYFVFGLNFFLHFIPDQPQPGGAAGAYSAGLFQTGYFFPFMKTIEVIGGALLLSGFFVPLSVAVLAPITVHIFLFHIFLAPAGAVMGIVLLVLNLYLAWAYSENFKPLFKGKATIS